MNKKLVALALLVIMALSSFGVAFADSTITKDADRKPLDAAITLCAVNYPTVNDDYPHAGGITWTYKAIGQAYNTIYYFWIPADANIQSDPASYKAFSLRYQGLEIADYDSYDSPFITTDSFVKADRPRNELELMKNEAIDILSNMMKRAQRDWPALNTYINDVSNGLDTTAKKLDYFYNDFLYDLYDDEDVYKSNTATISSAALREALRVTKSELISYPTALLMQSDLNLIYNVDNKPSVKVYQVGNVVLTVTQDDGNYVFISEFKSAPRKTYPDAYELAVVTYGLLDLRGTIVAKVDDAVSARYGDLIDSAFTGYKVHKNKSTPGDTVTIYNNAFVTYDVQYAKAQQELGDYTTANSAGYYFTNDTLTVRNIIPGVSGNMNYATPYTREARYLAPIYGVGDFEGKATPMYWQAALAHQHQYLSEIDFSLAHLTENNFDDYNTVRLNTYHGEFASRYQFVYVNAPSSTPYLDKTLTLSASTSTAGVTVAVDGSTVIATYGSIAADKIDFKVSVYDRNMKLVFKHADTDAWEDNLNDKDLILYADYVRWDDDMPSTVNGGKFYPDGITDVPVSLDKATTYDQFHATGLVDYAGVKYIVTQPITIAQNPTAVQSIGIGKPKDLRMGGTDKMNIIYKPTAAIFDGKLTFESLTPEICTVDANGVVTGVKNGTGYIVVTGTDLKGAKLYYNNDDNDAINTDKPADLTNKLKIEITVTDKAVIFMKNAVIVGTDAPIYKKADATSDYYGIVGVGTIIDYTSDTKVVNGFLEVTHHGAPAYIKMSNVSFETNAPAAAADSTTPVDTTTPVTSAINMTVVTKGGALNIRNAPAGAVVGKVANGTVLVVVDTTNPQWYKLDNGSYAAASYLK